MNSRLSRMVAAERRLVPDRNVGLKFGVAFAVSLGGILYTFHRHKIMKSLPSNPSSSSPGNGSRIGSGNEDGERGDDNCALKEPSKRVEELERENEKLRSKVAILEERERNLGMELLEYYGLKEQESAVLELRNQLKLNNMEAKLYNLKIESLTSANERLEGQLDDYAKVVTELEAAKAKAKQLWKKLKCEADESREQILALQDRVLRLQEKERKAVALDKEAEMQLKERKELREELEEMKRMNHGLKTENSELVQKLEYLQMLAPSAIDDDEVQALKEERNSLKQQNEDLTKEIERLHANRCMDVEELVYLRWINACLRYEMRNYQATGGKTLAKDLSKALSPKSEHKAKQLILEYANKEGFGDKAPDILTDFDSGRWSSSQGSCLTDSSERDDFNVNTLAPISEDNNKTGKKKVFSKLKRLLKGKSCTPSPRTKPRTRTLERQGSADNYMNTGYLSDFSGVSDDIIKNLKGSLGNSSRGSFDLRGSYPQKCGEVVSGSCSMRTCHDDSLSAFKRIESLMEDENDWSPGVSRRRDQDSRDEVKYELKKFAEVLKNSHVKSL